MNGPSANDGNLLDVQAPEESSGRSPLLLIVFNRPQPTRQVFEAIRAAQVPRLYVACDGPRADRPDDAAKVAMVKSIVADVDWPCAVHTLFRQENAGCRDAVAGAVSWFFEHERAGVVLEDDCVPHPDFFTFCDWALEAYRDDLRVWHVNGNTFGQAPVDEGGPAFGALPQSWGWASWRDRWAHFERDGAPVMRTALSSWSRWRLPWRARAVKLGHAVRILDGLDTWDYQWQIAVLGARGLCACPPVNLITNVGSGLDATHTADDDRLHRPTHALPRSLVRSEPCHDARLTEWYCAHMAMHSTRSALGAIVRTARAVGGPGLLSRLGRHPTVRRPRS